MSCWEARSVSEGLLLGSPDCLVVDIIGNAYVYLVESCGQLTFRDKSSVLGIPGHEVYWDLEITNYIPGDSPLLTLAKCAQAELQAVFDQLIPAPLDISFINQRFYLLALFSRATGYNPG